MNLSWNHFVERVQTFFIRASFGASAREDFYQQLALLVGNGVKIDVALRSIYDVAMTGQKGEPHGQAVIFKDLIVGVGSGQKFSTILGKWVGVQEASVVAAGEASGELLMAFQRCVKSMERRRMLVEAVTKPLLLPAGLVVLLFGVMVFTGFGFAPPLLKLLPLERWTGATKNLLVMGLFFARWWWLVLGVVVALVMVFVRSLGRWRGRMRARVDQTGTLWAILCPPLAGYGIYRIYQASIFLDNVAQMLASGVKLDVCLDLLGRYASPWLRERVDATAKGLGSGSRLGAALHASGYRFPDRKTISFLRVLESTNGAAEALEGFTERWVKLQVKQIAVTAVGIRLFAFIAAGVVILTFLAGIYGVSQVSDSLRQGAAGGV